MHASHRENIQVIFAFFSHQKEIEDYKIFEEFAETEVPGFVDHVHVTK